MTHHEIVKKLIGKIGPVGETNTDNERFEYLKETCHLVEMLLMDISDMAYSYKDSHEYSVKRAADYGIKFLERVRLEIK